MRVAALLVVTALACAPPPVVPPVDGGDPPVVDDGGPPPPPPEDAGPPPECLEAPVGDANERVFQETRHTPAPIDDDAAYGGFIDVVGDRLFVSAAGHGERGALFVHATADLTGVVQILEPSSGDVDEDLSSAAASESVVVLGAQDQAALGGRAWWFEDTGAGFVERGELTPVPATIDRERFGVAADVSADGDVVVVAASAQRVNGLDTAGSVHIFRRVAGQMIHAQQVRSPEPRPFEQFGIAVALDDDGGFLLVGATQIGDGGGQVHSYAVEAGAFVHVETIASPEPQNTDVFGGTLDVDEGRALIGDPRVGGGGQVWALTRCGDRLTDITQIVGPEVENGDAFGLSVKLTEGGALIGRFGFIDRFVFDGATWVYVQALEPINRQTGDGFGGSALELSPQRILTGRPGLVGGQVVELNEFE
jgi:hypothetical protein